MFCPSSNKMAREEVVPWSKARIQRFIGGPPLVVVASSIAEKPPCAQMPRNATFGAGEINWPQDIVMIWGDGV
jgi:hypothetical protein